MSNLIEPSWPPPYTIRRSLKSKRLSIKISPQKGLVLVIPRRTSLSLAIDFLNQKQEWVQKHQHLLTKQPVCLPEKIDLLTIGEHWKVVYSSNFNKKLFASDASQVLFINAQENEYPKLIKKWLKEKASKHLPTLLADCSQRYGLSYRNLSVRLQRCRWGSCTKDNRIHLNCKLLLLPKELTEYIMVHELVHTLHFDHSPRFWATVAGFLPHYAQLKSALKKIEHSLPNWLY